LHEIGRAITQELELDKLLARILNIAVEMLAGQAGLIALRGEEGGWTVSTSHGIPDAFINYLDPLLKAIPDQEDPAKFELPQINTLLKEVTRVASFGFLDGVGLPLVFRSRVVGMIFIFRNYSGRFSGNDRALLQSFADQAAIAVRNAQFYTQIRREKQRMDTLLDSAADGILILRAEQTIERCNPAFANLLGKPIREINERPHGEVIHWNRVESGIPLEQAINQGWPLTPHANLYIEGDLARPDLMPLPVGITYAPLLSPDGQLINIVATVALIKGYVGTLRREDAVWDRGIVEDSLAVIEDEADRLTELIENLLDATRLQSGTISLNRSDLAIKDTAERIIERFTVQAPDHTFIMDFQDDFPVIMGDEDRLEQVLYNLLSNAVKYSPDGGEIKIVGQVRTEQVIICVSDQGPGIAPGDIPHVFDRFYRSSEASKKTKGAGLGLFLSRAVIEAHGGRIWVDPMPNQGARICFSIPR
jgi:signal transduction histidine kinase